MLPYGRQWIEDDDVEAVAKQLRGDWLTQGPTVLEFEKVLCSLTGARFAVAVATGTGALHLATLVAGVQPGDRGLTSTITFVASANAIAYAGGVPALLDVDPDTALVTAATLEERIADLPAPPRVIIPVDFAGNVADLPAISGIARRVGAKVIEDAAHALGATYRSEGSIVLAGSCQHSDLAILSFHPVKHITTGEGGAITTNDENMYRRLLDLRTHGITKDPERLSRNDGPWYYEQHSLGYNQRITDMQCALGISQAKKLPQFLSRRREIAGQYDVAFKSGRLAEHVLPLGNPPNVSSAYHLYVLCLRQREGEDLDSVAKRRKSLFLELRARGIAPQVHYIPVHRQPFYVERGYAAGEFPGADRFYAGCISLPMFPRMVDADVNHVVASVTEALLS